MNFTTKLLPMGNTNSSPIGNTVPQNKISEDASVDEVVVRSTDDVKTWLESKQDDKYISRILRDLTEVAMHNKRYDIMALTLVNKNLHSWKINEYFETALKTRDEEAIRLFYDMRMFPVTRALKLHDVEYFKTNPNTTNLYISLSDIVTHGDAETLRYFIQLSSEGHFKSSFGLSDQNEALICALKQRDTEKAKILIDYHYEILNEDYDFWTYTVAVENNCPEVLDYLYDKAPVNSPSFQIVKERKEKNNKLIKAAFNKVLIKRSRLLWIAKKKNSPQDCYFAMLPNEIIYNIAAHAFT